MDDLGDATFIPNATYSGPVKAQQGIKFVKEEAFTSANAEENGAAQWQRHARLSSTRRC